MPRRPVPRTRRPSLHRHTSARCLAAPKAFPRRLGRAGQSARACQRTASVSIAAPARGAPPTSAAVLSRGPTAARAIATLRGAGPVRPAGSRPRRKSISAVVQTGANASRERSRSSIALESQDAARGPVAATCTRTRTVTFTMPPATGTRRPPAAAPSTARRRRPSRPLMLVATSRPAASLPGHRRERRTLSECRRDAIHFDREVFETFAAWAQAASSVRGSVRRRRPFTMSLSGRLPELHAVTPVKPFPWLCYERYKLSLSDCRTRGGSDSRLD